MSASKMFLVMMSSSAHSDREEHPLAFTPDRAVAEDAVTGLERAIAPLYELVYRTGYDSRESKKYADLHTQAIAEVRRIVGEDADFRIDNFSRAWMVELGEIPTPSGHNSPTD